ncbi:MAG TPA: DUF3180 domain-containing protein [Streptosporangiaceae bacterium]|jgi:hypothetical protein
MTPTRPWILVALAAACAVAAWLLLGHFYSALPPLPWTAVPTLLLLAVVEGWAGRTIRDRIAGQRIGGRPADGQTARRIRPLPPIAVARTAALAKASAHSAAVLAGLAAGFVLYVAGSLAKTVPRGDAFAAFGTFIGAVALATAAVYLERSCRVPGDPDDEDQARPA